MRYSRNDYPEDTYDDYEDDRQYQRKGHPTAIKVGALLAGLATTSLIINAAIKDKGEGTAASATVAASPSYQPEIINSSPNPSPTTAAAHHAAPAPRPAPTHKASAPATHKPAPKPPVHHAPASPAAKRFTRPYQLPAAVTRVNYSPQNSSSQIQQPLYTVGGNAQHGTAINVDPGTVYKGGRLLISADLECISGNLEQVEFDFTSTHFLRSWKGAPACLDNLLTASDITSGKIPTPYQIFGI
jgi:hypothetical protein